MTTAFTGHPGSISSSSSTGSSTRTQRNLDRLAQIRVQEITSQFVSPLPTPHQFIAAVPTGPNHRRVVRNSAGGKSSLLPPHKRLLRFLILGSEGGTYYASERRLTLENVGAAMEMIRGGKGVEVVNMVLEVSKGGRGARQDPGVVVLALCLRFGDRETRDAGYRAIVEVCRTPTTLFRLISFTTTLSNQSHLQILFQESASSQCDGEEPHPDSVQRPAYPPLKNGKGWGRSMRKALSEWYNSRSAESLLFIVTKYRTRCGWTHRDVIRLAHVLPKSKAHDLVFRFLTYGIDVVTCVKKAVVVDEVEDVEGSRKSGVVFSSGEFPKLDGTCESAEPTKFLWGDDEEVPANLSEQSVVTSFQPVSDMKKKWKPTPKTYDASRFTSGKGRARKTLALIHTYHRVLHSTDLDEVLEAIRTYRLAREHISMHLLNEVKVWSALLEDMPVTAMMRNLGKMTSVGLFGESEEATKKVVSVLKDGERIRKARVHPLLVLMALTTYKAGSGVKGGLWWNPVTEITTALESAFYSSFTNVIPAGKRFVIAIDVSGSMMVSISGTHLQCRMAAAAMAMVLMRTEPDVKVMAFGTHYVPVDIKATDSISNVMKKCEGLGMMGTDCAVPMLHAAEKGMEVDAFIILTDSETWYGKVLPKDALRDYREKMRIDAKLVVVGMISNGFTIADPDDAGMLDVVGFDSNAPAIIQMARLRISTTNLLVLKSMQSTIGLNANLSENIEVFGAE
ncbi:60 kDa SS-A/Ro ribonucleoprotein, partial [Dinochytrium kinnereticum]